MKKKGRIRRLVGGIFRYCRALSFHRRICLAGGLVTAILSPLIGFFEPMPPYHAPFAALLGATSIVLFFGVWRTSLTTAWKRLRAWVRHHKRRAVILGLVVAMLAAVLVLTPLGPSPFSGMNKAQLTEKIDTDYRGLKRSVFELDSVLRGLRAQSEILQIDDLKDLELADRQRVLKLWAEFAQHVQYYDLLIDDYRYFYRIFYFKHKFLHNKAYLIGYTAFVTRFLCATEIMNLIRANQMWERILDDADRDLNIRAGVYSQLKSLVVDADDLARLTVGYGHLKLLKQSWGNDAFEVREGEMFDYVDGCFTRCATELALNTTTWAPQNGIDALKEQSFKVWFPVQKAAAGSTGHVRFTTRRDNYIGTAELARLDGMLEPGDILVERRNWYLSNVGIPGFWPHAAIHIGTREEFLAYFGEDPEVQALTGEAGIDGYMAAHCGRAWREYTGDIQIIEAIEPGVVFNTLAGSAGADYTAAMRPRLAKKDKFLAMCAAFTHYRKPYDYNFDFITDSALVCTELVYKSYLEGDQKQGIRFPLIKHAGRDLCTAQLMVETFDKELGTPDRQLDFVVFLDYDAKKQEIVWADGKAFRNSYKRAKWSVALE